MDRIDHIIAGLLSLSKSAELKIMRVDLADVVRQTLLLLEPELHARHITVEEEIETDSTVIEGDQAQLKQLLLNILLNSIQAMPGGGKISLDLAENTPGGEEDHHDLVVTVKDTGRGIAPEDLPKVFDPFFTTKESGTGLGLSISYGIVSKHGGEIRIGSSPDGTGTAVTIQLPRHIPGGNP